MFDTNFHNFYDRPYELDIRDFKQTGVALKEAIIQAVKDTQAVVVRSLPDKLVVTKAQFDDLQDDPLLQGMYDSKNFMYMTPLNVMEVIVR